MQRTLIKGQYLNKSLVTVSTSSGIFDREKSITQNPTCPDPQVSVAGAQTVSLKFSETFLMSAGTVTSIPIPLHKAIKPEYSQEGVPSSKGESKIERLAIHHGLFAEMAE
jgi:hypothetical protein